ncbi:hypothetical protein Tco_1337345 [Tanacetum coccineum]
MSTPSKNNQMHNDIMAAGSRERPPMLEPVEQETYADATQEKRRLIDAEAKAIHIILMELVMTYTQQWMLVLQLGKCGLLLNQQQDLDTLSYHRLFDILKQHQNEVNEIRDEKIDRNANPLELVVAAQQYPDKYSSDTKEIAKPITTLSKSAFEEESDPEQAQRYKDMQKNLALITKYIKNIYKPTNNNLRNIHQTLGTRLWILLQDLGMKDNLDSGPTYDAKPLEKVHLDDHYNVFATNRHHSKQPESINDTCMVETVDSNVILGSSGMCDNEGQADQNTKNPGDERVFLASLIANFKLDLDENKKSQRNLKKANMPITQELNKSQQDLEKTKQDLEKSKQVLEKTKQDLEISKQNLTYFKSDLEKYKIFQMNQKDKAKTELECARALGIGKSSFANPLYLKQAQNEKPCLYNVKYDKSDLANLFAPEPDETIRLAEESRSKLYTLMPVTLDTKSRALLFETQLKTEMFADLKYVQSLEREVDELQTDKNEFSKEYNLLLQECVSKDIMCYILCSFESLDEKTELQSLYLEKVEECECLAIELPKRTKNEQLKNDKVWKQKESSSFRDQNEQYFIIQDLKAQLQDKNIAISKLKKLIEKMKGKYVDTKFEEPSVFQEPNAFKFQKPSVLEKLTPFSNFPFSNSIFYPTTNVNKNLSKPVTLQILPQSGEQAIRNMNVIKPEMYQLDTRPTQTRTPQLPQTSRNTNPRVSKWSVWVKSRNISFTPSCFVKTLVMFMLFYSQVKLKKTEVDDHYRISSCSNKIKYESTCNDILKSRTSNVNAVCATYRKCVFNSNHDACVSKFINDVNARTKKPKVEPISASKPKRQANQSVVTPKKTFSSESTIQKSRSYFRIPYEKIRNMMIKRVYYVEGLNHNLFLVGQFCDVDLEVAFRKSTCFVRDLQRNDLLTGNHEFDLYTISLQEISHQLESISWQRSYQLTHGYGIVDSLILTLTPSTCFPRRILDGENLNKIKEKGDPCILVGYSTKSKGYRVNNKRTKLIVKSIHINFDELKEMTMASDHDNSSPAPQLQKTSDHNRSELRIQDHNKEPTSSKLVPNVSPLAETDAPSL